MASPRAQNCENVPPVAPVEHQRISFHLSRRGTIFAFLRLTDRSATFISLFTFVLLQAARTTKHCYLDQGGYVYPVFVFFSLFVCLSGCLSATSRKKTTDPTFMKILPDVSVDSKEVIKFLKSPDSPPGSFPIYEFLKDLSTCEIGHFSQRGS